MGDLIDDDRIENTFCLEDYIDGAFKSIPRENVKVVGKNQRRIWSIPIEDKKAKPYCEIAEYSIAPAEGIYTLYGLQSFMGEIQQAIDFRTASPPEERRDFTEDTKKGVVRFGRLLYLDHIADITEEKKVSSELMFKTGSIPPEFKGYLERSRTEQNHTHTTRPIYVGATIAFYPCEDIAKQQSPIDYISIKRFHKLNPKNKRFQNLFSWFEG